jgi:hypothetical protein
MHSAFGNKVDRDCSLAEPADRGVSKWFVNVRTGWIEGTSDNTESTSNT